MLKMLILFTVLLVPFANANKISNEKRDQSSRSLASSEVIANSSSYSSSLKEAIMTFDLIGGTKGLSQVSLEHRLTDKNLIAAHLSSRVIENDDKTIRSTEAKGLMLARHLTGEFGRPGVLVGGGALSYIDFDNSKLTKGLAFVGYAAAQIIAGDQVVIRLYGLTSNTSVVGGLGLQIGAAF